MPHLSIWKNAARASMARVNPEYVDQFETLIEFLVSSPNAGRTKLERLSQLDAMAGSYASSRRPKLPKPPETVPDEVVSVIMNVYFEVPTGDLERAKKEHQLSMAAENLVGDLVERYIATELEPMGWVWCSGSVVTAVDVDRRAKRTPLAG